MRFLENTILIVVAFFVLPNANQIVANPLTRISYQGQLKTANSTQVDSGTFFMQFRIWSASIDGVSLWSNPSPVAIEVVNGLFAYELGSDTPIPDSLLQYDSLWLGITLGDDNEISPRTRLTSVLFSLRSLVSDSSENTSFAWHSKLADTALLALNGPHIRRIAIDSVGGTVSSSSFVSVGSLLSIPPSDIRHLVIILLRVQASHDRSCGPGGAYVQISTGRLDSMVVRDSQELFWSSGGGLGTRETSSIQFAYEPTETEKTSGFLISVSLRSDSVGSFCAHPWVTLLRCEALGE